MENLGFIEILIILLVLILPLIALIDILKSDFQKNVNKIIWVLVTLLLPIVGSILYFIIGKKQKLKK